MYYHSTVSICYLFRLKLSVESAWNLSNIYTINLLIKFNGFLQLHDKILLDLFVVILFSKNYAQTLVDADRTSLFLVDNRTNELYARIFDIGGSLEDSRSSNLQKEIRWDFNKVPKYSHSGSSTCWMPKGLTKYVLYNQVSLHLYYRCSFPYIKLLLGWTTEDFGIIYYSG